MKSCNSVNLCESSYTSKIQAAYLKLSFSFNLVLFCILQLIAVQTAEAFFLEDDNFPSSNCEASLCVDVYLDRKNKFRKFERLHQSATDEEMENYYRDIKRRCKVVDNLKKCLDKQQNECLGDLYYHQNRRIPKNMFRKYHCARAKKFLKRFKIKNLNSTSDGKQTASKNLSKSSRKSSQRSNLRKCIYEEAPQQKYKLCSLFGDQHLRTFADGFETCNMVGTYPLIDNKNLVVMATSAPVLPQSNATILSKITVLIKQQNNCAEDKTYAASVEQLLPNVFKDGSRFSDRGGVYIDEVVSNSHVEINIPYIATVLVIRKISNYLTFAAKMPQELVNELETFEQLCVSGCPKQMSSYLDNVDLKAPVQSVIPVKRKNLNIFDEQKARKFCKRTLLSRIGYVGVDNTNEKGDKYKDYLDPGTYTFQLLKESKFLNPENTKVEIESIKLDSKAYKENYTNKKRRSLNTENEEECGSDKFNFYFESCVVDLVATGDTNLSLTSEVAFEDARLLHDLGSEAPGASIEIIKKWPGSNECRPKIFRNKVDSVKYEKVSDGHSASNSTHYSNCLVVFSLIVFVLVTTFDMNLESNYKQKTRIKATKQYRTLLKSEKNLANNRLYSQININDSSYEHFYNSNLHT